MYQHNPYLGLRNTSNEQPTETKKLFRIAVADQIKIS